MVSSTITFEVTSSLLTSSLIVFSPTLKASISSGVEINLISIVDSFDVKKSSGTNSLVVPNSLVIEVITL